MAPIGVGSTVGAKGFAAQCRCGSPLVQPVTGRPRRTCSEACRRRCDYLTRRVRRRQAWQALWRAQEGGGRYSRAEIRHEVALLQAEIDGLLAELEGHAEPPAA